MHGWCHQHGRKSTLYQTECQHQPKGNPTLIADQVPQFLKELSGYSVGQFDLVAIVMKMHRLLCTRLGALAALERSWVSEWNDLMVILGVTPDLKRPADQMDVDHLIPLADASRETLDHFMKD